MKKKLFINGGLGSGSAKRVAQGLSQALGYKVFRSLKAFPKKTKIKYGQGVDKLTQYKWFAANDIPALEYTTEQAVYLQWQAEGHTVFARKLLNSSCGHGIVTLDGGSTVLAPVYTKYKKKKREFRVHVYKDSVVRVVEKKMRSDWDGPRNPKIRNIANGFVFCSCTDEPSGIRELAIKASKVVSSDFRGVDIGYNEKHNELFIIEVNSAPGIEGANVQAYVDNIINTL